MIDYVFDVSLEVFITFISGLCEVQGKTTIPPNKASQFVGHLQLPSRGPHFAINRPNTLVPEMYSRFI